VLRTLGAHTSTLRAAADAAGGSRLVRTYHKGYGVGVV
jgi:hypothetical protein